ncbi:MAG: hypothetical protein AAFQ65_13875 [Myxococcota bacterium]
MNDQVCLTIDQIAFGLVPPDALEEAGIPERFCFGEELAATEQLVAPLEAGARY